MGDLTNPNKANRIFVCSGMHWSFQAIPEITLAGNNGRFWLCSSLMQWKQLYKA